MDIEGAEKKLSAIDKFLTSLKQLLKKHWGILLLILFGLFIYWVATLPPVYEPLPYPEQVDDYQQDEFALPYQAPVVDPVVEDEYDQELGEPFYYEEEDY